MNRQSSDQSGRVGLVARALAALGAMVLAAGCASGASPNSAGSTGATGCTNPAGCAATPECVAGDKKCGDGGLYACGAAQTYQRVTECTCAATPQPHCASATCPAGATLICDGDGIRDCATGAVQDCSGGRCVLAGTTPVCATKRGDSQCLRSTPAGDVLIACADGDHLATDRVCDLRTGLCKASAFDCARAIRRT